MAKPKPKQRVREEERRLRKLEYFQKNQTLFNRERMMRQLRDARPQAEALENYLASLSPAYRQAADADARRERLVKMILASFRGRTVPEEVLGFYPTSYENLRGAL